MTKFEKGKSQVKNFRNKAVTGYKRFSVFAHASALAVLVAYAGNNIADELKAGDHDLPTIVLTVSTVLVGMTALFLYVKFFTDEN